MKYTFTKENFVAIAKVFGWSISSAVVATSIMVMQQTEFPPEYAFLVPLINVILYSLKEYMADR